MLSIILFAILFYLLTYILSYQQQLPREYYFTFLESFLITIIYVGPIYLFFGLPIAMLIDKILSKLPIYPRWVYYLYGVLSFSIAGVVIGILILVILSIPFSWNMDLFGLFLLCTIASNTYYHLSLLFFKLNRQKRTITLWFMQNKTS